MSLFTDDFERADGALGSDWDTVVGGSFAFNPLQIVSGMVEPTVVAGDDGFMVQSLTAGGDDQWAEITFGALNPNGSGGCGVRADAAAGTGYLCSVEPGGSWLLYKYTPAYAPIASGSGLTVTSTSTVRLSAVGANLRLYVDGAIITSINDASLTTGKPAIVAYTNGAFSDVGIASFSSNVISSSITWSRVKTIPFIYGGCGGQGITCMGDADMLAGVEENIAPSPPGFNVLRPFLSNDNGLTWTEIETLASDENLSRSKLRTTGVTDQVLAGMVGPQNIGDYEPGASVIVRTSDSGHSWTSSVASAVYATSLFATAGYDAQDFLVTTFGTTFAFGQFGPSASAFTYMTSTDGGAQFVTPTSFGVSSLGSHGGAQLSTQILVAGDTGHNPIRIFRSINQGAAWSPVNVLAVSGTVQGLARIGSLGSGQGAIATTGQRAFYSNDFGASWTASTISGSAQNAQDVIGLSEDYVALGLDVSAAQIAAGGSPFRLSNDGGVNFSLTGTYADTLSVGVAYRVMQLAVSNDGAVLAIAQTDDGSNTNPTEIWRGVISDFAGPGPCGAPTTTGANIFAGTWVDTQMVPVFA